MKYPQLVSMPSAVSDWLEEQLEARGIDAVLYTRYILSLLHSDTVDVIYSEEDLSHLKKEVRRSGGSRKRFRRSSDWWRHAQADAEKLKRSAAVECLMSASEQTCGIESLIDELCAKLNESEEITDPPTDQSDHTELLQQLSPQELAKRYYAAFPPLGRNASSPPSLISLIPKWITSPKKIQETMKATRTAGKQRFGAYFTGSAHNKRDTWFMGQDDDTHDWSIFKTGSNAMAEQVVASDEWKLEDDETMYDDLPVDIKELLDDDSPTPNVELMNRANMRDTGTRNFIPCGTNITSSIWSSEAAGGEDSAIFDNTYNAAVDLDLPFSSITIHNNTQWCTADEDYNFTSENDCNAYLERCKSLWSSGDAPSPNHISLQKINHSKEASPFAEVVPKPRSPLFGSFSKVIGSGIHTPIRTIDPEKEADDLFTSVHSHFRPINEKPDNYLQSQYADGATFAVATNWDPINYRRTESGGMYMEGDYTMRKKYCEFKPKNSLSNLDFVLKYLVCQNDKSCQTEELDAEVEETFMGRRRRKGAAGALSGLKAAAAAAPKCTCLEAVPGDCLLHPSRAASSALSEEFKPHAIVATCGKCNSNDTEFWNTDELKKFRRDWDSSKLREIWSGGEVCHECLGRPPSTLQHSKLREDVSHDGDQLLSDLSSIQKTYMEDVGFSCEINDFFVPKERKRRHSLIAAHTDEELWSFASRLEEDCLIQMSTMPTLRSVTL